MEELNVDKCLILKKPEEEGPEIRGGTVDALIIQATKTARNGGKIKFACSALALPEMRYYVYSFILCVYFVIMCIVLAIFFATFLHYCY